MENQEPMPAGQSAATNLSSNATLIWRVFLPVFGTVFFSGMLLALWLIDEEELYFPYPALWPRLIILAIWLGWLFYVRRALWPLLRIDADHTYVFITNYWTSARYPWADVEGISRQKHWGRKVFRLRLKAPGHFGQNVLFLPGSHFQAWMTENNKLNLLLQDDSN